MFKAVSPKVDVQKLEREQLDFCRANRIFERSMQEREGAPQYVTYEGPPTVNGNPGVHHVLARAFKDLFPRYKTMRGYYCLRKGGWDTHGLPVGEPDGLDRRIAEHRAGKSRCVCIVAKRVDR